MTGFCSIQDSFYPLQCGIGGQTLGFVQNHNAVNGITFTPSSHDFDLMKDLGPMQSEAIRLIFIDSRPIAILLPGLVNKLGHPLRIPNRLIIVKTQLGHDS